MAVLPGIGGILVGALPYTLEFVTSATFTGATFTIPAAARAGDLAVIFQLSNGASPVNATTPTGWSRIIAFATNAANNSSHDWKILTSADLSTTFTGTTDGEEDTKLLLIFRPSRTILSVVKSTWLTADLGSGDNPAAQTIAAAGQPTPVIAFGVKMGVSTTSYSNLTLGTVSPAFNSSISAQSGKAQGSLLIGYKIFNENPVNVTVDPPAQSGATGFLTGYLYVT